jgi:dTDP-glucose pyrophosphorylase/CBS domain-containing protein
MEPKLGVNLEEVQVSPSTSIRDVIACLDRNALGIALVVDSKHRLLDTITDREIRRAILAGHDLSAPVTDLINYRSPQEQQMVAANERMDQLTMMQLMQKRQVYHLPVVDDEGRVVRLILFHHLFQVNQLPIVAVVHARSLGITLAQAATTAGLATVNFPILEWLLKDLRHSGITTLNIISDFMPQVVQITPSNREDFPLEIEYLSEDQALGPAGILGLINNWAEGLLYISGNILTLTNFRAMFEFHRQEMADVTVAICDHRLKQPETYGFFQLDENGGVSQSQMLHINTGIYLFSPSIRQFITKGDPLTITALTQRLIKSNGKMVGFSVGEYWIDTELLARYEQALNRA